MERPRIRINLGENGKITWNRGGEGLSVRDFVDQHPCEAMEFLTGGGMSTELGDPLLSTIGGRGKLQEFNKQHGCGQEENLIQQI